MRKIEFSNEEYYHIFNCGVDKREVFLSDEDYEMFLKSMQEFNQINLIGSLYQKSFRDRQVNNLGSKSPIGLLEPKLVGSELVDVICYCLNPNHYHFILKQLVDRGVEKYMHKISMGYTNYFNKKYSRSGSLFQGTFKAIHIDSNDYLLYLSAYVNKNNFIHNYNNSNWKYSSLAEFEKENSQRKCFCNVAPILDQFENKKEYVQFLNDNADYLKNKKEEEKYLLETD